VAHRTPFTRSLANRYGPEGIRANCLCPGWVRTPATEREMGALARASGITLEEQFCSIPGPSGASPCASGSSKRCSRRLADCPSIWLRTPRADPVAIDSTLELESEPGAALGRVFQLDGPTQVVCDALDERKA
jgi:hypothetical protein